MGGKDDDIWKIEYIYRNIKSISILLPGHNSSFLLTAVSFYLDAPLESQALISLNELWKQFHTTVLVLITCYSWYCLYFCCLSWNITPFRAASFLNNFFFLLSFFNLYTLNQIQWQAHGMHAILVNRTNESLSSLPNQWLPHVHQWLWHHLKPFIGSFSSLFINYFSYPNNLLGHIDFIFAICFMAISACTITLPPLHVKSCYLNFLIFFPPFLLMLISVPLVT